MKGPGKKKRGLAAAVETLVSHYNDDTMSNEDHGHLEHAGHIAAKKATKRKAALSSSHSNAKPRAMPPSANPAGKVQGYPGLNAGGVELGTGGGGDVSASGAGQGSSGSSNAGAAAEDVKAVEYKSSEVPQESR
jgi:hypothetical protein